MPADTQYVKLPDGSYGAFPSSMKDAEIEAAVARNFPPGMNLPTAPLPKTNMQESLAPKAVKAATSALLGIGALAGGTLSSPGIATTAAGMGLGAMAGKQGELLANRAIFGEDETSPTSLKGLVDTGIEGAAYAIPAAGMEADESALLGRPLESGFGSARSALGTLPMRTSVEPNLNPDIRVSGTERLGTLPSESNASGLGTLSENGVSIIPEPRAPFPGEQPNYMASVPRQRLGTLAAQGKPGAGSQLQQLGEPVIYIPRRW